jgi:hypothetical protein
MLLSVNHIPSFLWVLLMAFQCWFLGYLFFYIIFNIFVNHLILKVEYYVGALFICGFHNSHKPKHRKIIFWTSSNGSVFK